MMKAKASGMKKMRSMMKKASSMMRRMKAMKVSSFLVTNLKSSLGITFWIVLNEP